MGGVGPNVAPGGKPDIRVIPFGKYLLLDRLAVGGMAEVYTAKSFGIEGFEKIIAIKRILPTMAEDEDFIQMFIDEAKIAGHLTHANIAPIYELGKIGDSHYIAMEYIWGKDLLQLMNRFRKMRKSMPPSMCAFIGSKMCEGLDYAHRKKDRHGRPLNIIHRDVSPQNALVSYEGQVKMIDFGIAKAAARNTKTQAGVLKGKFGYMSPEQVRGLPVDHRSDVFAVGTCMYEMLTSERLFVGESDFTTLEKVRNATVTPLGQIIPDMPPELDGIVMKALAREVEDRWQSAGEMQEALTAYIAKERPPFGTSKLSAWMRTAFAAEIAKEKGRLDLFAKVGPPPSVPPPPPNRASMGGRPPPPPPQRQAPADDEDPPELAGESTMISSSPFDEAQEAAAAQGEEMLGQPTQIFFSSDDEQALAQGPDHAAPAMNLPGHGAPIQLHSETLAAPPPGPAPAPSFGQGAVAVQQPMRVGAPQQTGPRPVMPAPSQPGLASPGMAPPMMAPQPQPQQGFAAPPGQTMQGGFAQPQPGGFAQPGQPMLMPPPDPNAPPGLMPPPGQRHQETMEMRVPAQPAQKKSRAPLIIGAVFGTLALAAIAVIGFLVLNRPQVGVIEIRTSPPEARANVLVDGTMRGQAPLRLENVAAGAHSIILQADGFASATRDVSVTANGTSSLEVALTPMTGLVAGIAPVPTIVPLGVPPIVPATGVPVAPIGAIAPVPIPPPTTVVIAPLPPPTTVVAAPPPPTTVAAAPPPPSRAPTPPPPTTVAHVAPPPPTTTTRPVAAPPPTTTAVAPRPVPMPAPTTTGPTRIPTPTAPPATHATPTAPPSAGGGGARGHLMIQTLPWARVFLDGHDTGRNTPVRDLPVSAGSHRIGLRTTDGTMHEETVQVPAGETVRIVRQL
jgi:serine/threonine protein kinase